MELAPLFLSRVQFVWVVSFHILLPAFTMGLATFIAVLEGLHFFKRDPVYLRLSQYWLRIFGVSFGLGVVSGIVMPFQFGSNWSTFADRAGPIIGPLMAYEVLTAFFLEAGFLGIMLFGLTRVGKALHYVATLAVAGGTLASAFWILAANSWMQTPAGFTISASGQLLPASWLQIIFNPSFPYRLVHMVLAAYLSTALVVGGVAAWHLLHRHDTPEVRRMFSMAMWMAALVAPIQILAGDMHGLNTLEHQPAKIMAIEGHFESSTDGAPLVLFGLPDQDAGRVLGAIEIPWALLAGAQARLARTVGWTRYGAPRRVAAGGDHLLDLSRHGGLGSRDLRARGRESDRARAGLALRESPAAPCRVAARSRRNPGRDRRLVHHRSWTAALHGLSRTAYGRIRLAAGNAGRVPISLAAFAVVYFTVFGAGAFYILRLIGSPPHVGESPTTEPGPQRSAASCRGACV